MLKKLINHFILGLATYGSLFIFSYIFNLFLTKITKPIILMVGVFIESMLILTFVGYLITKIVKYLEEKELKRPIILPILIFIFLSSYYIFLPAFFSVYDVCYRTEEQRNINRWAMAQVQVDLVNGSYVSNATYFDGSENNPEIIKHEKCHIKQNEQGRIFGCSAKISKFINEAECYIKQKL